MLSAMSDATAKMQVELKLSAFAWLDELPKSPSFLIEK
jgi:hypothetical protein